MTTQLSTETETYFDQRPSHPAIPAEVVRYMQAEQEARAIREKALDRWLESGDYEQAETRLAYLKADTSYQHALSNLWQARDRALNGPLFIDFECTCRDGDDVTVCPFCKALLAKYEQEAEDD